MSKSMSRTVLWSGFRGTEEEEEEGDAGLDKGLMPILHFSDSPTRGYSSALRCESTKEESMSWFREQLGRKTLKCTGGTT